MKYTVRRFTGEDEVLDITDPHGPACRCCGSVAMGVSRLTETHVRRVSENPEAWEARVGVAIMGGCNESNECSDPFSEEYHDNFARGRGITKEAAVLDMMAEMRRLSNTLFDE